MPTSGHQGPIETSISNMLVGRFWRVLKKWWSRIILNASYPSLKCMCLDHLGTVPRPSQMRIWKYVGFRDCITQGYEIEEYWRSEITGKSKSSEPMTFRYIPDMINLAFFYLESKDQRNATVFKFVYFYIIRFIYQGMNKAQILESHSFRWKIMVPTGNSFFEQRKISTFLC